MSTPLLWSPSSRLIKSSNLTTFAHKVGYAEPNYAALHEWSVKNRPEFWQSVWDFTGILGNRGERILVDGEHFQNSRWFPDARLNYAENLLRIREDRTAIVGTNENGHRSTITFNELRKRTAQCAYVMRSMGIKQGDRVAAWLPNVPETLISMLATSSIGAVWSSCSPDFGFKGALDRLEQIQPKLLLACKTYRYNGKYYDASQNVQRLIEAISSIENCLYLNNDGTHDDFAEIWSHPERDLQFERFPFNHPLFIMYSSGTTGKPKCIVHGAGGTLVQHMKEHQLHADLRPTDVLFFFTTCGWMMWNWMVSALATGTTIILYDGSPFYSQPKRLIDLIDEESISAFGTGAKYFTSIEKSHVRPIQSHDLRTLRLILSTGSPLSHESFHSIYANFKKDVWLASISGGTDLISCFVLGNPWSPVYAGEIQGPGLGMETDVFDDKGKSILNTKGELVCKSSFPSVPVEFWNDPSGEKFHRSYFNRFNNVWTHSDFAERIEDTGGYIIHGRSDATLNPGGVRIGTAEIYRQVESMPEIVDAVCIDREWNHDTRIVLFVILQEGRKMTNALIHKIKQRIRENTTSHYVPWQVIQVQDIPRTRSGKIAEIAVRETVHGYEVKNTSALANPESLEHFKGLPELR